MAFNTEGAVGGASSGASIGATFGPIGAGVGAVAGGLAGGLMGKKKKKKGLDMAAVNATIQKGSKEQKDLIGQQFSDLQLQNQQYGKEREGLSASIEPAYSKIGDQLKAGYQGVGQAEQTAIGTKLGREQEIAARNIPLQQQLLREQLAATGNLRTGGAGKVLSAPVQEAAQQRSDLAAQLQAEAQSREASRLEKGAETEASLAKEAFTTKLGIDKDTMDTLLSLGRTDLIEKLSSLRGVSADETNAMLNMLGVQGNINMAESAADNASQQDIFSGLAGLGGTLAGSLASKMPKKTTATVSGRQVNVKPY
jgi:hypothetical protein